MGIQLSNKYERELDFDAINHNINFNLNKISKYPRGAILKPFIELKFEEKLPINPRVAIIDFMLLQDLIIITEKHIIDISQFGLEVQRKGGWLKYLEREQAKQIRDDRKNKYDYITSKWKAATFWPVLILAAVGGIYGAINIYQKFINPTVNSKVERLEQQIVELRKIINDQPQKHPDDPK